MKKEIDPEILLHKKFLIKCKFKALIRKVMANAHWLAEFIDVYEGDDVKRRVAQAVRQKSSKKMLLTVNDKALLNKPAADRTDQEKKYIYRIIGGLKCFKRYPDKVKKKLAAVTYFKYYKPGRVIVREKQEAFAMYFIVSGEVAITQQVFDDVLRTNVELKIGHMFAGDSFGEVSLLHNIPRSATATTVDHCEFLMLMKRDFNNVLKVSVQKDWDKVWASMSSFTYFEGLDEVAMREGCIVAKMKSYNTDETVFGDGVGVHNYVYFILKGQCQMIENFKVITKDYSGHKVYKMYDPYVPSESDSEEYTSKYLSKSTQETSPLAASGTTLPSKSFLSTRSNVASASNLPITSNILSRSILNARSKNVIERSSMVPSIRTHRVSQQSQKSCLTVSMQPTIEEEKDDVQTICVSDPNVEWRASMKLSILTEPLPPVKYHTYFMQVCRFNPGSTFGFGENMRDRRIIATTPVECLLLPVVWLLQRNTANIWTRIRHYLDKTLPTKKEMFKIFVEERRWLDYRDEIVADVVARSKTVNLTSIHDVPYSIRLEEMYDI